MAVVEWTKRATTPTNETKGQMRLLGTRRDGEQPEEKRSTRRTGSMGGQQVEQPEALPKFVLGYFKTNQQTNKLTEMITLMAEDTSAESMRYLNDTLSDLPQTASGGRLWVTFPSVLLLLALLGLFIHQKDGARRKDQKAANSESRQVVRTTPTARAGRSRALRCRGGWRGALTDLLVGRTTPRRGSVPLVYSWEPAVGRGGGGLYGQSVNGKNDKNKFCSTGSSSSNRGVVYRGETVANNNRSCISLAGVMSAMGEGEYACMYNKPSLVSDDAMSVASTSAPTTGGLYMSGRISEREGGEATTDLVFWEANRHSPTRGTGKSLLSRGEEGGVSLVSKAKAESLFGFWERREDPSLDVYAALAGGDNGVGRNSVGEWEKGWEGRTERL
eukprot:GHVS01088778.1.p1 GENE.GHVS01088778.1~~GHVS01088778.1.p1  ORF type:complete len:388 (+),score=65.01 GHVS01088778.1:654-1817(+)